jgi:hypothetical protein
VLLFDDTTDPYQMRPLAVEQNRELFDDLCHKLATLLKENNDVWYRQRVLCDILPYQ